MTFSVFSLLLSFMRILVIRFRVHLENPRLSHLEILYLIKLRILFFSKWGHIRMNRGLGPGNIFLGEGLPFNLVQVHASNSIYICKGARTPIQARSLWFNVTKDFFDVTVRKVERKAVFAVATVLFKEGLSHVAKKRKWTYHSAPAISSTLLRKDIPEQKARDRSWLPCYKEALENCSISQNLNLWKWTNRKFHPVRQTS